MIKAVEGSWSAAMEVLDALWSSRLKAAMADGEARMFIGSMPLPNALWGRTRFFGTARLFRHQIRLKPRRAFNARTDGGRTPAASGYFCWSGHDSPP